MSKRWLGLLANGSTFVSLVLVAILVRPLWVSVLVMVVVAASGVANYAQGIRQREGRT